MNPSSGLFSSKLFVKHSVKLYLWSKISTYNLILLLQNRNKNVQVRHCRGKYISHLNKTVKCIFGLLLYSKII